MLSSATNTLRTPRGDTVQPCQGKHSSAEPARKLAELYRVGWKHQLIVQRRLTNQLRVDPRTIVDSPPMGRNDLPPQTPSGGRICMTQLMVIRWLPTDR